MEDINQQMVKHTQEVNERKQRKYRRDTLDYKLDEVYTWADIYARKRQSKPQTSNTETSSSESDTTLTARRPLTTVTKSLQPTLPSTTITTMQTTSNQPFLELGSNVEEDPGGERTAGQEVIIREPPQTRPKKDKGRKGQ